METIAKWLFALGVVGAVSEYDASQKPGCVAWFIIIMFAGVIPVMVGSWLLSEQLAETVKTISAFLVIFWLSHFALFTAKARTLLLPTGWVRFEAVLAVCLLGYPGIIGVLSALEYQRFTKAAQGSSPVHETAPGLRR